MTRFLDFDGALHPGASAKQFKFCQRHLIGGILREVQEIDAPTQARVWKKIVGPWLRSEHLLPWLRDKQQIMKEPRCEQ